MDYLKKLRKKVGHMPLILPHALIILFNKEGEILFEEREDDGFIDFPGGNIDFNESAEDAAVRELKEETGLIANKLEFFNLYSGPITRYKYFNGDEISGLDAVYICKDYSGVLKEDKKEVKKLFFSSINKVKGNLSPRNKQILEDLKGYKL